MILSIKHCRSPKNLSATARSGLTRSFGACATTSPTAPVGWTRTTWRHGWRYSSASRSTICSPTGGSSNGGVALFAGIHGHVRLLPYPRSVTRFVPRQMETPSEPHAGLQPRRPLELFELPMVFSQAPLLTADEFRRELDRRGLWPMKLGQLEELHRTRLLQPLFRVLRDVRGAMAAARREAR